MWAPENLKLERFQYIPTPEFEIIRFHSQLQIFNKNLTLCFEKYFKSHEEHILGPVPY